MSKRNKVFLGLSIIILIGFISSYFYKIDSKKNINNDQLLKQLVSMNKEFNQEPYGRAYKNGNYSEILEDFKKKKKYKNEKFFSFSIRYLDLKEPVIMTDQNMKDIVDETLHYLDEKNKKTDEIKVHSLAGNFLKRLALNRLDEYLKINVTNQILKLKVTDPIYLDLLDVLVNYNKINDEVIKSVINALYLKDSNLTFELLTILESSSDKIVIGELIKNLSKNYNKFSAELQPLVFRILTTKGHEYNINKEDYLKKALSKNEDIWIDSCLTVIATINDRTPYKFYLTKISNDLSKSNFHERAMLLLNSK